MTIAWHYKNSSGATLAKLPSTTVGFSGFDSTVNGASEPGFDLPQDSGGTSPSTGSFSGSADMNTYAGKTSSFVSTKCGSSTGLTALKLGGAGTGADPSQASIGQSHTVTFKYNGTNGIDGSGQRFTVPAGVTSIQVAAFGAQGGCDSNGGDGGEASGTVAVSPGDLLIVYVGGDPGSNSGPGGGFNGGGGQSPSFGCGGGGASDVRVFPYGLANRVVVGGGGGGEGNIGSAGPHPICGGVGGYPSGSPGCSTASNPVAPAGPGTQSSGGVGGAGGGGAGALALGGTGGTSGDQVLVGSGGGGGYYGGGGGGYDGPEGNFALAEGGGGGSSFFVNGCSAAACPSGVQTGNGSVTITYYS